MDNIQKDHLLVTAKWQKILGVLMMIGVVLMALAGIVMVVAGFVAGDEIDDNPIVGQFGAIGAGILYLVMAFLYYFFAHYLLKASKALKLWGITNDEADLTKGLKNTKSFFKFSGILSLVSIAICVIAVIVIAIATAAGLLS
jgi:hypothetical protein